VIVIDDVKTSDADESTAADAAVPLSSSTLQPHQPSDKISLSVSDNGTKILTRLFVSFH